VERVDGLMLAAFPARQQPFDVLLTKDNVRLRTCRTAP